MKFLTSFLLFSFVVSLVAETPNLSPKSKKANSVYESILKNGWLEEKKQLGYELGKIGKEAEPFILKLFQAESYWDQEAAISAASVYSSPKVNAGLVDQYLNNHMVDTEAEKILSSNIDSYYKELTDVWDTEFREEKKKKILKLICLSSHPDSKALVKREIEDPKSKYRIFAFQFMSAKNDPKDKEFIRGKVDDKDFRASVLKYILETGNKNDKSIMMSVLAEPKISASEFISAIGGIKKWGNFEEQEAEYTKALQNPKYEDSLKLYSIFLFKEFRSEPIRESLCELAKFSKDQSSRLASSEALVPFQDVRNLECLKRIANEEYQSGSQGFGFADAVAMFATLGLSNLMKGIQENRSRSYFLARQIEIKKHIQFLELKSKE